MFAAVLLLAASTAALDTMVKAAVAPCPPPHGEITVCARRTEPGERSRYLSPIAPDYDVGDPRARSASAERNGLFDYDSGGAGSCSAVGAFGANGCFAKAEKRRIQQRAGARDHRGPLYDK
jgi:hypothetical protein